MSIEAWLTIAGILVTLALSFVGLTISILGFFLKRELSRSDKRLQILEENQEATCRRIGRCEGALAIRPPTTTVKLTGKEDTL